MWPSTFFLQNHKNCTFPSPCASLFCFWFKFKYFENKSSKTLYIPGDLGGTPQKHLLQKLQLRPANGQTESYKTFESVLLSLKHPFWGRGCPPPHCIELIFCAWGLWLWIYIIYRIITFTFGNRSSPNMSITVINWL